MTLGLGTATVLLAVGVAAGDAISVAAGLSGAVLALVTLGLVPGLGVRVAAPGSTDE